MNFKGCTLFESQNVEDCVYQIHLRQLNTAHEDDTDMNLWMQTEILN